MIEESEVVRQSKEYAAKIKEETETRCRELLEGAKAKSEEMVTSAQTDADDIMNQASEWSSNLREKTTTYIDDLMKNTDEMLVRNVNDIRKLRSSFQNMLNND